jgi:hypothetical protein
MTLPEESALAEIRAAIELLEEALMHFVNHIGSPDFIDDPDAPRFRYASPTLLVFIMLRAVRVVSGLNALVVLLRAGFTQEMGVLIRTISEFLTDIGFAEDALTSPTPTHDQLRLAELYFTDEGESTEELLARQRQPERISRKKMVAGEARIVSPENPFRLQQLKQSEENVFSDYVHGAYPRVMEMYEGGTKRFLVQGMAETPMILIWRRQIALYVHRALNDFASVAHGIGLLDLDKRLIQCRCIFEQSSAYSD